MGLNPVIKFEIAEIKSAKWLHFESFYRRTLHPLALPIPSPLLEPGSWAPRGAPRGAPRVCPGA
jgi:hypothetical protein